MKLVFIVVNLAFIFGSLGPAQETTEGAGQETDSNSLQDSKPAAPLKSPFAFSNSLLDGIMIRDRISTPINIQDYFTRFQETKHAASPIANEVYANRLENAEPTSPEDIKTLQAFKKEVTNMAQNKKDLEEKRKSQNNDMFKSLNVAYKKLETALEDQDIDLDKIKKIVTDARSLCETYSSFKDLISDQSERVAQFCGNSREGVGFGTINCLNNPFRSVTEYGDFMGTDKIKEPDKQELIDTEGRLEIKASKTIERLMTDPENRRAARSMYQAVTGDPRDISSSTTLQNNLAFLHMASFCDGLPYEVIQPFADFANNMKAKTAKEGEFSEIKKMQIALANEYHVISDPNVKFQNLSAQKDLISAFYSLQRCVKTHSIATDEWPVGEEGRQMLSSFQMRRSSCGCILGDIDRIALGAKSEDPNHKSGLADANKVADGLIDNLNTNVSKKNDLPVGLDFPELFIRQELENGRSVTTETADHLMIEAAYRSLPDFIYLGEKVRVDDPDVFHKLRKLSIFALGENFSFNENLDAKYPLARLYEKDGASEKEKLEIQRQNEAKGKEYLEYYQKAMAQFSETSYGMYYIPTSEKIKIHGFNNTENQTIIDIQYDLPYIEPKERRHIIVTRHESQVLKIEYWKNGVLTPAPPPFRVGNDQ